MRLLRSALMIALLTSPVLIAASGPANAFCYRKCTSILSSGACSADERVCEPVEASVAKKLKALPDGMRCRSEGLLCDYTGCKTVCGAPKMAKK
jgi:hypothetical protein